MFSLSARSRSRLVVMLDFQNLGVTAQRVPALDHFIIKEIEKVGQSVEGGIFKAFCRPDQREAMAALKGLDWRTKSDESDMDTPIIQESKSDCGHDPDDTTLVICSKDGDFSELVEEMRAWGTQVFVMGPHDSSRNLREVAGRFWIPLPYF